MRPVCSELITFLPERSSASFQGALYCLLIMNKPPYYDPSFDKRIVLWFGVCKRRDGADRRFLWSQVARSRHHKAGEVFCPHVLVQQLHFVRSSPRSSLLIGEPDLNALRTMCTAWLKKMSGETFESASFLHFQISDIPIINIIIIPEIV